MIQLVAATLVEKIFLMQPTGVVVKIHLKFFLFASYLKNVSDFWSFLGWTDGKLPKNFAFLTNADLSLTFADTSIYWRV